MLSKLIKDKGSVIDEAVGLSATFEDAPGYTEATQIIKNKINKRKANTIDKPFSALIKKIKTNSATAKEINNFNTISKRLMKEEGVDYHIIKIGNNLKKEKPQGGNGDVGNDPVMNKIKNMAELYANILKVVHNQEYLKDLDKGLQKDIATSFFIEYNKR